jgi:outer membrane protein assembly factor BamB
VAISGNTAIVGAFDAGDDGYRSGAAYLFDVKTGQQRARLVPGDGVPNGHFGRSVAISGDTLLIGAEGDDEYGPFTGAAYLFDAATGEQLAKLFAADGVEGDFFGQSVAVSNNIAVVGAPWDDDNGSNSGSVYVFDIRTGQQLAILQPPVDVPGERFGISVAANGNTAVIGYLAEPQIEPGSDGYIGAGLAFVYVNDK